MKNSSKIKELPETSTFSGNAEEAVEIALQELRSEINEEARLKSDVQLTTSETNNNHPRRAWITIRQDSEEMSRTEGTTYRRRYKVPVATYAVI